MILLGGARELTAALQVVFKFAWAIPDDRAVKIVAAMSPVVEVGAGRGYWARLVREAGGAVECYDIEPNDKPSENTPHSVPFPNWVHVKQGGPECVLRHPGSTLMLCYPDGASALCCLGR